MKLAAAPCFLLKRKPKIIIGSVESHCLLFKFMVTKNKGKFYFYIIFFILIVYLLINTGVASDDYTHLVSSQNIRIIELILPTGGWLATPIENYTHRIWYPLFNLNNLNVANILKITYILLSFYFITKFFSIYLNGLDVFLASFIFIFFPVHDSAVYCFINQYLVLSMAFYLYAYYLAYNNKLFFAFSMAIFASFVSYGSPVIALSLFIIFVLNKHVKKGLILLIPNIIYSIYYIFLIKAGNRLPAHLDVIAIGRQLIFQVLSFFDSVIGPSMWLKIYYAFFQLSLTSFIIGIIGTISFYKKYRDSNKRYDFKVIFGLVTLVAFSLVMFAVTGRYPQMAFNLGNRIMIFSSLLISYLIILVPFSKKIKTLFFAILFFSILGISDHWKRWDIQQQNIITNIKNNHQLEKFKGIIYVSGNQFSTYGAISHIEFFSNEDVVSSLFQYLSGGSIEARPINKLYKYEKGYLIDTKFDKKDKVGDFINVYDSEKNELFKVRAEHINQFIALLPANNRHWIQIVSNKWIKDIILIFMPQFKYALR